MSELSAVVKALSEKYGISENDVAKMCPAELSLRPYTPMSRQTCEMLVLRWEREVEGVWRKVHAAKIEYDAKRLRYFRSRFGPRITMNDLPRGAK